MAGGFKWSGNKWQVVVQQAGASCLLHSTQSTKSKGGCAFLQFVNQLKGPFQLCHAAAARGTRRGSGQRYRRSSVVLPVRGAADAPSALRPSTAFSCLNTAVTSAGARMVTSAQL